VADSARKSGLASGFVRLWEYGAAAKLLFFLRWLPQRLALPLAELAGLACGIAVRRWRDVAENNLKRALPELDAAARSRVRRGVYRNLGRVALALAKLPVWSEQTVRHHVDFAGLEHFRAAEAKGNGVLLLTGHLGNWELGALAHGAVVGPISVMVRPISNPLVNRLVEARRSAHGNRVIAKRSSAREVLRPLADGGTVGILADQTTLPEDAVFVEFFGMPAAAHKGFAQLALRSGAAVVPAFALWNASSRRHVVEYGPEIEIVRSGEADRDIEINTQRFQGVLEDRIRANPEQWLWIHRRWKTQPTAKSA